MVLNQDFKEFIKLLNEKKVKYLIIGGYAVAYHGYPRYTKDLDLWVWMDKTNAEQLIESFKSFGFESLGLKVEDFLDPENIIQLGYPPNRIDLLTDVKALDFQESYQNRKEVEYEGIKFDFLNLDDLIKTKKATGRLQDLADAEQLKKIQNKKNNP